MFPAELEALSNQRDLPSFTATITEDDLNRLAQIHRSRVAEKTWQARASDLRQFKIWCQAHQVNPNIPTSADLCLWLSHMATDNSLNRLRYDVSTGESTLYRGNALAVRSIRRRHSSIKWFFDQQTTGKNPATDALVHGQLAGISRLLPSKPKRAAAIRTEWLAPIVADIETDGFVGLRDQLIVTLGFAGAMRVSDLAALQIEHVRLFPNGAILGFEQRKRRNEYSQIHIVAGQNPNSCPILLLQRYLSVIGRQHGALLVRANRNGAPAKLALHPSSIARIIKKRSNVVAPPFAHISGHSLRRGFIDSALAKGAPISEVMKVSGHKDPKTLMLYLDDCGMFANHAGSGLY
ncbi:tyrosine-type recombinase/integrase [Ferrimonas lipolytica]|uniref:Tyrosine-type recombinase/integrase n=1 Tax=Ferrimonas lipolytica TaxID=2724191 RepID=A0A6H1UBW1_9GAMM|nr:tyrosine-type recombinase/integrase [Ferrimonas lipolytica]QIZ76577.1 tyrosine-type recombinase/integrase [Ferrimonas lipolytica]